MNAPEPKTESLAQYFPMVCQSKFLTDIPDKNSKFF